jgi:hypothetical protein
MFRARLFGLAAQTLDAIVKHSVQFRCEPNRIVLGSATYQPTTQFPDTVLEFHPRLSLPQASGAYTRSGSQEIRSSL